LEWLLRKWENNAHMNPATWLVSRELTEAAGPWDTRLIYCEDGEYFCRVILASNGIRFVPEGTVFYRVAPSSASYMGRSTRKMESHLLSRELEIGYLRSLEDNERVRAACLKSLQTVFTNFFYPEQPALVRQSQQLAAQVGGRLQTPRLPWKYVWIQKLFGLTTARRVRQQWNECKSSAMRSWDKALFHLEGGKMARRTKPFAKPR